MIKEILQEALNKVNCEKQQAIAQAISKNKNEIVSPKFVEIENAKQAAIAELQKQFNEQVESIKIKSENAKKTFEESQQAYVTATIEASYSSAISQLEKQINEIK